MASGCAFCDIAAGIEPAFVVLDEPAVIAFLDRRPLFHGHVLVSPREHYVTVPETPPPLYGEVMAAVQRLAAAVPAALDAQGTFIATNNIVSQSVPHLHVHVVPRTRGDGLRGFFWPRTTYASDEQAADVAASIRAAL